jgi:hypothetical protein
MSDVIPNPGMARPDHLLEPGEHAIWWGRPNLGVFVRGEIMRAAISLGATALLLLAWWRLPQLASYQNYLFVAAFFGVALGGSALVDVMKSFFAFGSTSYLMTDQRLVVARKDGVKAMAIADAHKTSLYPLKDGFGDVKFFTETTSVSEQLADSLTTNSLSLLDLIPTTTLVDGFICVANAAAVEAMIKARHAAAN